MALSKGRASSFDLRLCAARLLALSLATGCTFHVRWVASEFNAGDYGSRHPQDGTQAVRCHPQSLVWSPVGLYDADLGGPLSRRHAPSWSSVLPADSPAPAQAAAGGGGPSSQAGSCSFASCQEDDRESFGSWSKASSAWEAVAGGPCLESPMLLGDAWSTSSDEGLLPPALLLPPPSHVALILVYVCLQVHRTVR